MSHIAVERNRRRQMNEHLKVLRSLTPSFYVKRGDQASIIGGAVEFIKELHLVLHSVEAKKHRMLRRSSSNSKSLSPRTPTQPAIWSTDTTKRLLHDSNYNIINTPPAGWCRSSASADVEAKICGSNVVVRMVSKRIPGQVANIISTLEGLALEVLHLTISTVQDTVLYYFVLKIGFECRVSVEELVVQVQQTFDRVDLPNVITAHHQQPTSYI